MVPADDESDPWVADLAAIYAPHTTHSRWRSDPPTWPSWPAGDRAPFGPAERAEFAHGQTHTIDSLAGLIATHSRQLVMDPAQRARELAQVRSYLRSRRETAQGSFRLPMLTGVLRAVKTVP